MSEKISMELWYDHSFDELHTKSWKTRIWVRIYDNTGNPMSGVTIRLYATTLSTPPCEEEIKIDTRGNGRPEYQLFNDSELATAISRDNGEIELIFLGCANSDGGLLIEAIAYDPPLCYEQSFWYVSFTTPESRLCLREHTEAGWETYLYTDEYYCKRFIGPPKEPWKAVRQWKIEETRKSGIEKIVKEIDDHLAVKSLQSYDGLLVNLSEMRIAAKQIEVDFTERALSLIHI